VSPVNSAWDPLVLLKSQILRLKKKKGNADAGRANAQSKRCRSVLILKYSHILHIHNKKLKKKHKI